MTAPDPDAIPLGECEYFDGERWVLTEYWEWDGDACDVRVPDDAHPTKGAREWVPADRVRPVTER